MMEFGDLVKLEPRLQPLAQRAVSLRSMPLHEREMAWYTSLKPDLSRFVGWDAKKSPLATAEAYDVAYQYLINLLDI